MQQRKRAGGHFDELEKIVELRRRNGANLPHQTTDSRPQHWQPHQAQVTPKLQVRKLVRTDPGQRS